MNDDDVIVVPLITSPAQPQPRSVSERARHNWSGFPGAYCLKCGCECTAEICIAEHSVLLECIYDHCMCEEDHPMKTCSVHVPHPCPVLDVE